MLIALKTREFGKDTVVGNMLSENLDMLPMRYTATSATSGSGQMSCYHGPDAGVSHENPLQLHCRNGQHSRGMLMGLRS